MRCALLLLLAATVTAQDIPLRLIYHHAKRLQGEHKAKYSKEQAELYQGKAKGTDLLYLGYLWKFAGDPAKAAAAYAGYLDSAGKDAKNRPTAMLEQVMALADAGRWKDVPAVADAFADESPTHKLLGRMRFYAARAYRAQGQLDKALDGFKGAVRADYELARYEVADCLVQQGEYELARREALGLKSTAAKVLLEALPHLGQPLPELEFGFWTGGQPAGIRTTPTVYVFWSMKASKVRDRIHEIGNRLAERFHGEAFVIGVNVYLQFDPSRMRTDEEMSPRAEEGFVKGWHRDYAVKHPLALLDNDELHQRCAIDPVLPALPAFAVSDSKGILRYVRVGASEWAAEAVESMLRVAIAEGE